MFSANLAARQLAGGSAASSHVIKKSNREKSSPAAPSPPDSRGQLTAGGAAGPHPSGGSKTGFVAAWRGGSGKRVWILEGTRRRFWIASVAVIDEEAREAWDGPHVPMRWARTGRGFVEARTENGTSFRLTPSSM